MTNEATIEKMKQMKLNGMRQAFQSSMHTNITHNFTPDELIAHLVDAEWDERYNRKLTRLIKALKKLKAINQPEDKSFHLSEIRCKNR